MPVRHHLFSALSARAISRPGGGWRAGRPEHFPGAQVALLTLGGRSAAVPNSAAAPQGRLLQRLRPQPAAAAGRCCRENSHPASRGLGSWLVVTKQGELPQSVTDEWRHRESHQRPLHASDSTLCSQPLIIPLSQAHNTFKHMSSLDLNPKMN